MKVYVSQGDFESFKNMQDEGRTRELTVTTFPMTENDIEVELK